MEAYDTTIKTHYLVDRLIVVIGTFTFPLWRTPARGQRNNGTLPELDPALQPAFDELPRSIQTSYQLMSEQNPSMARIWPLPV